MNGACGWIGKLPSSGDFLVRRVPAEFRAPWERWLDGLIDASREALGAAWRERFLTAPVWRFVLAPGVLTPSGWTGVMAPSVDCVGRYYPLTLVYALGARPLAVDAALTTLSGWLDAAERVATAALSPAIGPEDFDAAVGALAPPPSPSGTADRGAPRSAWQTRDSELAPGWQFSIEGMPGPERYCEMLAGRPAALT
ncbi:MAG: type VI secretion system-associated protein TagF [Burkholderiales bacterium]|nr:type VI secretion system-associated protein TagF [Burkholderiales bacterium]